jgi:hypothetical protein
MEAAEAVPMEQTPEFQSAVAKAVAGILPDLIAKLTPAGASGPSHENQGWAEQLSMAIANLTDQRDGSRFVAPEVIRFRKQAREKMVDLIIDARTAWSEAKLRGDRHGMEANSPSYRLVGKVFLDETLVDPMYIEDGTHKALPTTIDWPSVPSDAMVPLNAVAEGIFSAFKDSVGNVSEKDKVQERPMHITRGGLVVKGPPPRGIRQTGIPDQSGAPPEPGEGLRIKHKGDKEYKEIHVLGTASAPARQSI